LSQTKDSILELKNIKKPLKTFKKMNLFQRLFGKKKVENEPKIEIQISQQLNFRHIPKYQSDWKNREEYERRIHNEENTRRDLDDNLVSAIMFNSLMSNTDDSNSNSSPDNSNNGFDGGFGGGGFSGGGSGSSYEDNSSNYDSGSSSYDSGSSESGSSSSSDW
jgi:hypothetical protein